MSSRVIVDSSVPVSYYLVDDPNHEAAEAILESTRGKILVFHPFVVQETITVLTYKSGVDVATKFVDDMMNSSDVIIPAIDLEKHINFFKKLNKKVSFTDVTLLALSKQTGDAILSFDKELLRLAKKL